jgi:endo-1,4-beta-xylanase
MIVRRNLLGGMCAVGAVASCNHALPARAEPTIAKPTLREAAHAAHLLYGSDADVPLAKAPDYAALLVRECDLYAPNIPWMRVNPRPDVFDFAFCQSDIDFVVDHGLQLSGYHLVWDQRAPEWFGGIDNPQAARDAISRYIDSLGTRYGAATYSWNVVNEAVNPAEGRPDGLRHTVFLRKIGPDFIDFAFRAAHSAAAHVMRVYNDYDLELATPTQEARRTAVLRLLDNLQRKDCPIDAIGVQSHLKLAQFSSFDPKVFRQFLREISSRNLKVLITELDVFDDMMAPVQTRDAAVADVYKSYLSAVLEERATVAVTTWGLSDKYTWLKGDYSPRFRRWDGSPSRPLPFDDRLRSKAAFDAIMGSFASAARRRG